MTPPRRAPSAWLGVLGLLVSVLALAGCGSPRPDVNSIEPLLAGPLIRTRILQPLEFKRCVFDLSDGGLVLCDGGGTPLPRPPESRQVFLSQQGELISVAFEPGAAAARAAVRYTSVCLRAADERVLFFKLWVPDLELRRNYEGREMEISVKYGRMSIINQLPLELYLARVLPSEMDPDHFTAETLKAQAVVARTWALRNLSRHRRYGYNFCDATHCQVYRGRRMVSRRAERAVRQTLGEVLTYQHKPAEAFYHSTCGGNTVSLRDAWGVDDLPYLTRIEDRWKPGNRPYCSHSPFADWDVWMSVHRLQRALQKEGLLPVGDELQDVQVAEVNDSGRVEKVALVTADGRRVLDVDALRRLVNQEFGRVKVLSKFFTLQVQGPFFILRGRGLGHGVGLCQWGARGMAQHGFGYREILEHYFPGTALEPAPEYTAPWAFAAGTTGTAAGASAPKTVKSPTITK